MDAASLQAKVYAGYAKAASVIGQTFDHYRVTNGGVTASIASGNHLGTLPAQFTVISTTGAFVRAPDLKTPIFDCLADGAQLQPGDVLVNTGAGTFFIAAMMPLLPIKAVRCTHTIEVHRARSPGGTTASPTFGVTTYSGVVPTTAAGAAGEDVIVTGVPVAIISGGFGRSNKMGMLPDDAPGPTKWVIYLPPYVTEGTIRDRDIIVNQLGDRYQIASATWGEFHYMLEAIRLET